MFGLGSTPGNAFNENGQSFLQEAPNHRIHIAFVHTVEQLEVLGEMLTLLFKVMIFICSFSILYHYHIDLLFPTSSRTLSHVPIH